jgi:D-aminopeptidase
MAMANLDTTKLSRRIDAAIAAWNAPGAPGVTAGVVVDGTLVAHRSAGLASVELGVPIGPETTFRIASVSKQFTCAAILMLAAEGRLAVDDDVRKHIPELADFGHRITLDHLMHNTSGLRDMLEIMRMGGADLSHPVRPEELMAGICRQRTLNFEPGSRYLYSNTNFLLLGRVVERVSGEKLRDFLQARIFGPAGMNATRMVESTTEIVPDLCTGYLPSGGGYVRAQHSFPLHGEGALVSSVIDLALWHRNYTTATACGSEVIAQLMEREAFTNGAMNSYARGLQVNQLRGLATVSHGGLWPGFKTEFLRLPERDIAIIVIANNAAADPYQIGQRILASLLEGVAGVHPVPEMPKAEALAAWAGRFLARDQPSTLELTLSKTGVLSGSSNGVPFGLKAEGDGRLLANRSSRDLTLRLSSDAQSLEVEQDAGIATTYYRVQPGGSLPADLPGTYRSEEMAATWTITARDGGYWVEIDGPVAHAPAWELEAIEGDIVRLYAPSNLYRSWLDIRVRRHDGGRVAGLFVNGGRVRNLVFTRVD